MATSIAKLHRDWLRSLPTLTGKTLTTMAKEIGLARSTLTRPANEDNGSSTLNARTIDKIVAHFKVPPPVGEGSIAPASDATLYVATRANNADLLDYLIRGLVNKRGNELIIWQMKSRALELEGFLPGDLVFVDPFAKPQPGDIVCAESKNFCLMRVYQRAAPVTVLVSRTLDPRLQETIVIDDERVVVKGVLLPHRLRA